MSGGIMSGGKDMRVVAFIICALILLTALVVTAVNVAQTGGHRQTAGVQTTDTGRHPVTKATPNR